MYFTKRHNVVSDVNKFFIDAVCPVCIDPSVFHFLESNVQLSEIKKNGKISI